jgi:hypothetical protein
MSEDVVLRASFEAFDFEYRGILRVPWNPRKTKLDGKLELRDNPGLNRNKINNFKIAVRFIDQSYTRDFGVIDGKRMMEFVVDCYAELTALNVFTTEIEVLDRWPSKLGDDYMESGNQYSTDDADAKAREVRVAPKASAKVKSPKRK